MNVICNQCGKTFKANLSDIKRGWAKCCSKSCAAKHRESFEENKVVSLFEIIKSCINSGIKIKFEKWNNQLRVELEIPIREDPNSLDTAISSQFLPISDHLYEKKIVDCIKYQIQKLKQKQDEVLRRSSK
ncbi:MAG TPA: hypothetical protein VHA52_04955 [Candidatus Babeliaceae bacterium]|nr:hypothetical protein [Candidatus Babeliaceae bacterium]